MEVDPPRIPEKETETSIDRTICLLREQQTQLVRALAGTMKIEEEHTTHPKYHETDLKERERQRLEGDQRSWSWRPQLLGLEKPDNAREQSNTNPVALQHVPPLVTTNRGRPIPKLDTIRTGLSSSSRRTHP